MIQFAASVLVLAGAVSTASDATPASGLDHPRLGEAAPAFALQIAGGEKTISLADYEGSILVVHFGASW